MKKRFSIRLASLLLCLVAVDHLYADAYDPPAGYYDSATGTGATLKAQLTTIMSTGHIQRRYGDFRYSAIIHDADPNTPGNIMLVYNLASVLGAWDQGNTWNREHVWPQSLQPGSASNSSIGNLGDPHALRPCNPSINSSRGNKPYGSFNTVGAYGSLGTFYFPGDDDKGDIARCLFYSATRWSSLGITLVNGAPGSNQMGDLQSLVRWNYTDPPNTFERRRNHAIYSSAMNPSYYTNNRNAYIDHPEFVWSVFGGGANDSTLYVGGVAPGDGASALTLDLGRVFTGDAVPVSQAVTLDKDGADPTYYAVTVAGAATSSVTGSLNVFDFDPQSTSLDIGISTSTATAGIKSGTVTIDNLDVSSGGAGMGSADGDDVVTVELNVLDRSDASFSSSSSVVSTVVPITVPVESGVHFIGVDVYNLGFHASQALLDIDGVSAVALPFAFVGGLQAGVGASPATLTFSFDSTGQASGLYSETVTINVSDEDLPGEAFGTLSLQLDVTVGALMGDYDTDGDVDGADYITFAACMEGPSLTAPTPSPDCLAAFDFDADNDIDLADFAGFQGAFTGP